jgi:hypothetical protein
MQRIFPILFCWLLLTPAFAQRPVNLRVGYFGPNLTLPGVRASADYPVWTHSRQLIHRADTLTKTHQWLVSGSAGFYSRGLAQRGLFVGPQTGYQHIGRRGFTKTLLAGVGWLNLITPQTRYTDSNGKAYRVDVPAESVVMYSVETALGWTYRPRQGAAWGWSVRPSAFWYRDRANARSGSLAVSFELHYQLH